MVYSNNLRMHTSRTRPVQSERKSAVVRGGRLVFAEEKMTPRQAMKLALEDTATGKLQDVAS